jgi:hypothetical protein
MINYKEEVLKVSPDAEICQDWFDGDFLYWVDGEYDFPYSGYYYTEQEAWEAAYNNLKKNKL